MVLLRWKYAITFIQFSRVGVKIVIHTTLFESVSLVKTKQLCFCYLKVVGMTRSVIKPFTANVPHTPLYDFCSKPVT